MNKLFEIEKMNREDQSTKIVSNLIKYGFIDEYKEFILSNYPFEEDSKKYEMFNARVKSLYKRFVLDEKEKEEDFVNTLGLCCSFNKSLNNNSFREILSDYKIGLYDYMFSED